MKISVRNSRGFTLIEVLVAMVITTVALLGLLESLNLVTEQNVRNGARDRAMQIAEEQMRDFRTADYDSLPKPDYPDAYVYDVKSVVAKVRGVNVPFTVNQSINKIAADTDSLLVTVNVTWKYKDNDVTQGLQTIRSR